MCQTDIFKSEVSETASSTHIRHGYHHTTIYFNIVTSPALPTSPRSRMSIQTPVWFITGASSGFGKSIALEALSRGHKVIASARSASRISDLLEKGATTVSLDVTSPLSEIETIAKAAYEQYGYINHLVNAAGYVLVGAVEETRYATHAISL
jgi:hypothetical protein